MLSRNQVFCLKIWKLWAPTTIEFNVRTRFLLTNVYKRIFRIFFVLLSSWVICKNQKDLVFIHSFFIFLLITQDLNKTKKNPMLSRTPVQNFSKNNKLCGSWNSSKFSTSQNFSKFLGNNRALFKFRYQILHNLISIFIL